MFTQSQPYPEMIDLMSRLKARYKLKVVAVSNEGRELILYRNHKFKLGELIHLFAFSFFLHFRKPDEDIYRLALHCAQVIPEEAIG